MIDMQPFCWCRADLVQGELSKSVLSSSFYHNHCMTSAAWPFFFSSASASFATHHPSSTLPLIPLLPCSPYKPLPPPLPTWLSAIQLEQRWLDAWTRCDYQAQTAVSLSCPSVSSLALFPTSRLLSLSLSLPLHLLHPFSAAFIQIIYPSPDHSLCCLSPPSPPLCCRCYSNCLTLHPSLPTNTPSFSSSFWRSSKLTSTHLLIA